MSAGGLEALRTEAVELAGQSRDAHELARRAADAYIQAKEPTKVGDEVEHLATGNRFAVLRVGALDLAPFERGGEEEPLVEVLGRRILKSGTLGARIQILWSGFSSARFRVVGRYSPPEPKP